MTNIPVIRAANLSRTGFVENNTYAPLIPVNVRATEQHYQTYNTISVMKYGMALVAMGQDSDVEGLPYLLHDIKTPKTI